MALKSDRIHVDSQIDFFMNEVAERGKIAAISTVGSGAAMDQAVQLATCTFTTISGVRPLGILMCDVVNNDLTRQHENWHKEEVQIGGKVTIWNKGTVVTNMIYPGHTPVAGSIAYLAPSGFIGTSLLQTDSGADFGRDVLKVGRFLSTKDEDGYCKVSVNLP
jgi:hypothetical protein